MKAFLSGIKVGRKIKISGRVDIMRAPGSRIFLGDNMNIISSSKRCTAGSIYAPTKLRTHTKTAEIILNKNVGLNGTTIIARSRRIEIGEGTMIGPNVTILDSDYHDIWPPEDRLMNPAFEKDKNVTIGKNVWIGSDCLILRGARIGDNSVISACSVVQQKIPSNVVAGGRPAEVMFFLSSNPK